MRKDHSVPGTEPNPARMMAKPQSWESDAIATALRALHEGVARRDRSGPGDVGASAAYRSRLDADRKVVSLDELLRPYHQGGGFVQIQQEMTRARRIDQSCVLAVVDILGLCHGDTLPCHAGDAARVRSVAETMRSLLRRYDCIVRFGEDEFLCAILGVSMETAASRFRLIKSTLAGGPEPASVSVGLDVVHDDDPLDDVAVRGKIASCRPRRSTTI